MDNNSIYQIQEINFYELKKGFELFFHLKAYTVTGDLLASVGNPKEWYSVEVQDKSTKEKGTLYYKKESKEIIFEPAVQK